MQLTEQHKTSLVRFLKQAQQAEVHGLTTKAELMQIMDDDTAAIVQSILSLNPAVYGFKGKKLETESTPDDIVSITQSADRLSGEYAISHTVYLPPLVHAAFADMATAFQKENVGRQLLIGSGYRSPGYQIVTLLYILVKVYDFDVAQTLQRVALPEYSQHCSVSQTAIDMLNIDGEPTDEKPQLFADSIEYAWLVKNAQQYGFYESYPQNNPDGIMWEPWHWQFRNR